MKNIFLKFTTPILLSFVLISGCGTPSKNTINDTEKPGKLEVINYNSKDNSQITLSLPDNWSIQKSKNNIVEEFKFKLDKNKNITQYDSYLIFDNRKEPNKYELKLIPYYKDQPNGAALPNHCSIQKKAYEGETKLGVANILLLNCDSPKEQGETTYERIYTLIPIQGEEKAYNLDVSFKVGEKSEPYVKDIKYLLGASQ